MSLYDHIADFLNFFRPAATPGGGQLPYLGEEATPESTAAPPTSVRPMESAVIDRIASMASLVQWETSIRAMRRPERLLTRPAWIRKLVTHLLLDVVVTVAAIRDPASMAVVEYHVFSDSLKPTIYSRGGVTIYTYSEYDQSYQALLPDIMQFAGRVGQLQGLSPQKLRAAEDAYWEKWRRANMHEGILGVPETANLPGDLEQQAQTLALISRRMRDVPLAFLPRGITATSARQANALPIDKQYETILKHYCHYYGLPTSLMNLDLPTHTQLSLTAAYGSFLRQELIPLLRPIFEAIETFAGGEIDVDYNLVEKASESEEAEILKNLAQTGVITINELRERIDLPPRPDGDRYPDVAGAPGTNPDDSPGEDGDATDEPGYRDPRD